MKRRRKETKQKSRRYRLLILAAFLAVPLLYIGRRIYRFTDAVLEERNLNEQRVILRGENDVLKQRIDEYKKNSLIETKAREDLGMIKKGEKIYLIQKR